MDNTSHPQLRIKFAIGYVFPAADFDLINPQSIVTRYQRKISTLCLKEDRSEKRYNKYSNDANTGKKLPPSGVH